MKLNKKFFTNLEIVLIQGYRKLFNSEDAKKAAGEILGEKPDNPVDSQTALEIIEQLSDEEQSLLDLQFYIRKELPNVSKLPKQLTREEAIKVLNTYDKKIIQRTLLEMENYKQLTKKYNSVYLTLTKWIQKNLTGGTAANWDRSPKVSSGWECTYREALEYLSRKNIPYSEMQSHFEFVRKDGDIGVWRKI